MITPNTPNAVPTLAECCGSGQLFLFMTILESMFQSQSNLTYYNTNAPPFIDSPAGNYDYIVIGAGTGGCVVASRLTENPNIRVLLVEAGGMQPLALNVPLLAPLYANTEVDWQYKSEPNGKSFLGSNGSTIIRGKMLGGSTGFNGMDYVRGNRADYDGWAALGNVGWDYESVLPYFIKSEAETDYETMDKRCHGCCGLQPVENRYNPPITSIIMDAAKELGYPVVDDFCGDRQTGFSRIHSLTKNGERYSASRAFLHPAYGRPNLDIWLHAHVSKIVLVDDKIRPYATGVQVIDRFNRTITVQSSEEVIVCAGVFESPKLLMLSGIGAPKELKEHGIESIVNLPGVGKNLQDHAGISLQFNISQPNMNYMNWKMAQEYLVSRTGRLASKSGTGIAKLAFTTDAIRADNAEVQFRFHDDMALREQLCSTDGSADHIRSSQIVGVRPYLLQTKSRGYIRLSSANAMDKPLIHENMLDDDDDVERLLEPIALCQRLFQKTKAFRPFNVTLLPESDTPCMRHKLFSRQYWRCLIRYSTASVSHQVGTCKMGLANDRTAVVDNELRVHGVDGLRVIDGSIMPSLASANTNAATMMIAEKGVMDVIRTRNWKIKYNCENPII